MRKKGRTVRERGEENQVKDKQKHPTHTQIWRRRREEEGVKLALHAVCETPPSAYKDASVSAYSTSVCICLGCVLGRGH